MTSGLARTRASVAARSARSPGPSASHRRLLARPEVLGRHRVVLGDDLRRDPERAEKQRHDEPRAVLARRAVDEHAALPGTRDGGDDPPPAGRSGGASLVVLGQGRGLRSVARAAGSMNDRL